MQNWWEKKLEWNTICKKSDINSYLISKYSVVLLYLCFLKGFVKRVQITKSSVKGNLLTFIFYISFYLHLIKYGGFEASYNYWNCDKWLTKFAKSVGRFQDSLQYLSRLIKSEMVYNHYWYNEDWDVLYIHTCAYDNG